MILLFWGGGGVGEGGGVKYLCQFLDSVFYMESIIIRRVLRPHGSAHFTTCWDVREDPEDEIQDTPTALVVLINKSQ